VLDDRSTSRPGINVDIVIYFPFQHNPGCTGFGGRYIGLPPVFRLRQPNHGAENEEVDSFQVRDESLL
jgi:hypothetical protein